MADDITTPIPALTKFATDEHPSKGHVEWVKIFMGDDGVFVPVTGDAAAGLDVDVIRNRSHAAYYVTAEGGRVGYNSTTGYVTIPTGVGENPLCAFQNPVGSGKDCVMTLGEFGSSQNTRFRRYGGTAALSGLGTARSAGNRGGGSTPAVGKLYVAGQYTATNANETSTPANSSNIRKVAFIQAYDQYMTFLNSEVIIRPGSQMVWTIDNDANASFMATVYLEWHEVTAAA